jgi:hypothetical protein
VLPDGRRALVFNQENQGNFLRAVMLDGTDDPQVLWAWLGEPPWTVYVSRFSECIYAQVFDWQYFVKDGEIAFHGVLSLGTEAVLATLAARFTETVETRFMVDGVPYVERRFHRALDERITATCGRDPKVTPQVANLRIMGPEDRVRAIFAELLATIEEPILDRWPKA